MSINISKFRKKGIVILLMLAIIVPFFVSCIRYSNNYDFKISEYTMDVTIDEMGDMHVVESVTNKYNNPNTVFFKDLVYSKNNSFSNSSDRSQLVEDVRLVVKSSNGTFDSDVNSNTSNRFVGYSYKDDIDERGVRIKCSDQRSSCEQVLYYDADGIGEEATFTYYYTIKGAVTEYKDISEFNWVLLDYQPMNVENVKISITLPEGDYDIKDMNTYFHGTSYGVREFVSSNKIVITVDELVKDEKVETRLLLDKDVFTSVRSINKHDENREQDLIAFEENQIRKGQIETLIYYWGSIGVFVLMVFILLMLAIKCYKKYDKEFKSDFYNEYYRELPANYPPAVMGYLYNEKQISDEDLTATLLDLIRRRYLKLVNKSTTVNDDNPDYEIWLNKEMSLDDLTEYERHLIRWFIDDIGDNDKVTSKDLNSYCDVVENARNYQANNKKWVGLVEKEAEKYDFFDKETYKARTRYSEYGLIGFVFIAILYLMFKSKGYNVSLLLFSSSWFALFAYIAYVSGIHRKTKQGNEDFIRWKAFKKFLEDFSNFEDYPVPSLIIWEHYLVYATSFGIADKVMSQLKLKFDISTIDDRDYTFVVYYGLRYNNLVRLNSNINHAKSSAISTINRYNSSRSNGGFGGGRSGGGFSGGSSFGGGGGSFGGR